MQPKIKEFEAVKLAGISKETSMANDKTEVLWKRFMSIKVKTPSLANRDLYSVEQYKKAFLKGEFDPQTKFEKWAAVEVDDYAELPEGLEKLELEGGLYAVFRHRGTAQNFAGTAKYIFEDWLPKSEYQLDHRPHFEIMGSDYKGPDDPESLEDIYIPIRSK